MKKKAAAQPGIFDVIYRHQKITQIKKSGDYLSVLKRVINWEAFRPLLAVIHKKERKSNAGAKPFDCVLMFKILVLQATYNLSDDDVEFQILDRFSFMSFLGLQLEDTVPDAKTIWLFREQLKGHHLMDPLFTRLHAEIAQLGYVAKGGQMIDATFIEAPRQRNPKAINDQIKAGQFPEEWQDAAPAKIAQKDVDARWTKKNETRYYGYKNHINADQKNKLIQTFAVTHAAVHDSQVFEDLLDHRTDAKSGKKRAVYADSAYRSADKETWLEKQNIKSQIIEKAYRNTPLTEIQQQTNREKSSIRVRVEHIFGAQSQMGGHFVRTIGVARAAVKIGMMNVAYNMRRLTQLLKIDGKLAAFFKETGDKHREVAPNFA